MYANNLLYINSKPLRFPSLLYISIKIAPQLERSNPDEPATGNNGTITNQKILIK